MNFRPVVPPKKGRKEPWRFEREDKELYKQRNEVERAFRRLKAFRRIFTRYDKLDTMFSAFVYLALICIISLVEHYLETMRELIEKYSNIMLAKIKETMGLSICIMLYVTKQV
jgi:transposase